MNYNELDIALKDFGRYVVEQSKANLQKDKKGGGDLYNSISYKFRQETNAFLLEFLMEDYGMFQDQGVKGANPENVSPNSKIRGQQAPNSKYRFGSGSKRGTFKTFASKMAEFAKNKNIRFRIPKGKKGAGQFKAGNYKSMGYVIAKNIYNRGLKPSYFFTEPFEKAFANLPDEVLNQFSIDVENQLTLGIKN
jgi:hypothetical protein